MDFHEDAELGPFCERQVIFNARLERIAVIEDTKRGYIDPEVYLSSTSFKGKITWEDVERYVPFLEVVIIQNSPIEFSYKVAFSSASELDISAWRKIRELVGSVLGEFEVQRTGKRGTLFISKPPQADEAHMEKQRQILKKRQLCLEVAPVLKRRYKAILKDIRGKLSSGAKPSEIANIYELDEEYVRGELYSDDNHRAKPAEVAASALLAMMKKEDLHEKTGLDTVSKLKDEVLYRRTQGFPKRKKLPEVIFSKKLMVTEEKT